MRRRQRRADRHPVLVDRRQRQGQRHRGHARDRPGAGQGGLHLVDREPELCRRHGRRHKPRHTVVQRPVDAELQHRLDLRRPGHDRQHLRSPSRLGNGPTPSTFRSRSSLDGVNWVAIKTVSGNQSSGLAEFSGLSGTGRYVRIYCTQTSQGSDNYSLYDFQVYGTPVADLAQGRARLRVDRGKLQLRSADGRGRQQLNPVVERPVDAEHEHRLDLRRPRRDLQHLRGPPRLGDRLRRQLPDPDQRRRPELDHHRHDHRATRARGSPTSPASPA